MILKSVLALQKILSITIMGRNLGIPNPEIPFDLVGIEIPGLYAYNPGISGLSFYYNIIGVGFFEVGVISGLSRAHELKHACRHSKIWRNWKWSR